MASAVDLSAAQGLVHFRRSLLEDDSFVDWYVEPPGDSAVRWDYAVRFSDGDEAVVVFFNTQQGWVAQQSAIRRLARVNDQVAGGAKTFLTENLAKDNE